MEAQKKILLSQSQIEELVEELQEEIDDLKQCEKTTVHMQMMSRRRNKILEAEQQPLTVKVGDRTLDLKELTLSTKGRGVTSLIFLVGRFKTGHLFGFWSCNPCSTTSDQDKGWVVIDPETLEFTDECTTRSMGEWGGDFNAWKKTLKPKFGRMTIFMDFGEQVWKMEQ